MEIYPYTHIPSTLVTLFFGGGIIKFCTVHNTYIHYGTFVVDSRGNQA